MTEGHHKLLFTDPSDPTWTLVDFVGKTLVFHACSKIDLGVLRRKQKGEIEEVSEDACNYCCVEPPPGFIALYKLYTWDK
jgi:hypothetical protein